MNHFFDDFMIKMSTLVVIWQFCKLLSDYE